MSNLDVCWTELPVYGRTPSTSELVLGGRVVTGRGAVQPNISTIPGTGLSFMGHMGGFDRTAVKATGTSAWRPPDC